MKKNWLILGAVALAGAVVAARQSGVFALIQSTAKVGKQAEGAWLIPTTQLLGPWGQPQMLKGRPVDLAFDPARRILAVLNWRGVAFLDGTSLAQLGEARSKSTSYAGVAFRPDGAELWASEAARNGPDFLMMVKLNAQRLPEKTDRVQLQGHPVPVGIAFDKAGAKAYVAFSRNNSLAVFDVASRKLEREIPVGMAPFGVVVSEKAGRVFVSNRAGRRPREGDALAPTSGANIASDPATGATLSGTISIIDLKTNAVSEVAAGLAPSGLALSPDEKTLAVANGHSDSITLLDTESLKTREVKIPAYPEGTFGSQPVHVSYAPDGKRLYVVCGGTNAIAVIEREKVVGALPSGWFPSGIAVAGDGGLRVASIKGTGSTLRPDGRFISTAYEGMIQAVPAPDKAQLAAGLREVKAANQPKFTPAGGVENLRALGIQHVFLIIKENRTYDQVFGDMPQGNGDPKLVMYGREITPNHHALAEQYVLLDNFYTSSSISFDGHHWLMQAFVSDYVQRAFAASPRGYAWDMSDALTVSPRGFFWMGAPAGVTVRIYGEFCLPAEWDPATQNARDINERDLKQWSEYWQLYKAGKWQSAVGCSAAGVPALKALMSPRYPVNETTIPDQIRAEEFLRELKEREEKNDLANINVVTLTADHTNGTQPGSPTPRAMVADDDLALGRMIEAISKSKYWPKSLVLVVEDDAQDGIDHVDGHRTVALAVGPHVRRKAVDSNNYNQISMIKTIQEIFGIPPRTSFLKNSRAMTSVFTPQVSLEPYKCLPANVPLDEMNPPLKALNGRQLWAAQQSAAMNWADVDDVPSDVLNRILWGAAKGWDTPYPDVKKK